MLVTPALVRLRQEGHEFKASLDYLGNRKQVFSYRDPVSENHTKPNILVCLSEATLRGKSLLWLLLPCPSLSLR